MNTLLFTSTQRVLVLLGLIGNEDQLRSVLPGNTFDSAVLDLAAFLIISDTRSVVDDRVCRLERCDDEKRRHRNLFDGANPYLAILLTCHGDVVRCVLTIDRHGGVIEELHCRRKIDGADGFPRARIYEVEIEQYIPSWPEWKVRYFSLTLHASPAR